MFKKILFFGLTAFLLTGCAAGAAQLQQLPEEGVTLVLFLVTAGVTWVLLQLSALFKLELKGYANAIAAALAPVVVAALESYLQLIPPVFDNLVLSVIHLIVLLAGSLGTFWLFQRKPAPSLK